MSNMVIKRLPVGTRSKNVDPQNLELWFSRIEEDDSCSFKSQDLGKFFHPMAHNEAIIVGKSQLKIIEFFGTKEIPRNRFSVNSLKNIQSYTVFGEGQNKVIGVAKNSSYSIFYFQYSFISKRLLSFRSSIPYARCLNPSTDQERVIKKISICPKGKIVALNYQKELWLYHFTGFELKLKHSLLIRKILENAFLRRFEFAKYLEPSYLVMVGLLHRVSDYHQNSKSVTRGVGLALDLESGELIDLWPDLGITIDGKYHVKLFKKGDGRLVTCPSTKVVTLLDFKYDYFS